MKKIIVLLIFISISYSQVTLRQVESEEEITIIDDLYYKKDSKSPFSGKTQVLSVDGREETPLDFKTMYGKADANFGSRIIAYNYYKDGMFKETIIERVNYRYFIKNIIKKKDELYYLGNSKVPFTGEIPMSNIFVDYKVQFIEGRVADINNFPKELSVLASSNITLFPLPLYSEFDNQRLNLVAGKSSNFQLVAIINPSTRSYNCSRERDGYDTKREIETYAIDEIISKWDSDSLLSIEERNETNRNSFTPSEILKKIGESNLLFTFNNYSREMGYGYNSAGFATGEMSYINVLSSKDICSSDIFPNFTEFGILIDRKKFGIWFEYDFDKQAFEKKLYFNNVVEEIFVEDLEVKRKINKVEFIPYDKPPVPLMSIRPNYPDIAQEKGIEGQVVVQCFIDKEGKVTETIILKGIPGSGLNESSVAALRKTRFKPATFGGKKIGVWITIPLNFTLQN